MKLSDNDQVDPKIMKKLFSREEIDRILEKGFPSETELSGFPLGEKLIKLDKRAWTTDMRAIDFKSDEMPKIIPYIDSRQKLQEEIEGFERIISRMSNNNSEKAKYISQIVNNRKEISKIARQINDKAISMGRILAEEKIGELYYCHIRNATEGVRKLTTFTKKDKLEEKISIEADLNEECIRDFTTFLQNLDTELRSFLRFAALYHDIGKYYHRDRHPVLGKHLLESLNEEERRKFLSLFKDNEEVFYQLLELVGHHDVFGMLCTGEASRTSLIDSSALRLSHVEISKKLIDCLVILNLGDIYGSIGGIPGERLKMITSDWLYFRKTLSEYIDKKFSKRQIEDSFIENEQEPENTAERIKRLLISMIMYSKRGLDESEKASYDRKEILKKISSDDIIRSALVKQLGTSLSSFCSDFALVCKLDYMLRFLNNLANDWITYWENHPANDLNSVSAENYQKPENIQDLCKMLSPSCVEGLAVVLIEILSRLVCGYSDLTRTKEGRKRRIGLELMGLSRSKDIGDRVIALIVNDNEIRAEGMNWISDEATSWYLS